MRLLSKSSNRRACFHGAGAANSIKDIQPIRSRRSRNGGIHMILRLIIAAAIALFFTPASSVRAQEHPEHPKKTAEQPKQGAEHPKKGAEHPKGAETKQVSTADISAGI